MKCNHCERIIDKDDNFYELEGNVYCSNCVSESATTYYTIGNDPEDTYTDEEISEYSDIYEYIEDLKFKIKWAKERRKELELITNPNIFEKKV